MSGKDAIIDKILFDAKAQSENIINEAKDKAKDIISKAKSQVKAYSEEEIKRAESMLDDIEKRKVTVANLEVRKILLSAKQNVINETFNNSLEKIVNLNKSEYLKIIKGMLRAHAQDKDIVVISKNDKETITKTFINDTSKELGIKLTLSNKYGDFKGGIVLSSENYDKNITLDVELNTIRDEVEPKVAKMIFGDK